MNEQLRQLLLEAFAETHRFGDLEVDAILSGDLPEGKTKCDYCAFYTGKACGSPWSPAETLQRDFSPCLEGVEFAYTGIPRRELNQLFLDGKEIPFLTLNICPPDEHPEPADKRQDAVDQTRAGVMKAAASIRDDAFSHCPAYKAAMNADGREVHVKTQTPADDQDDDFEEVDPATRTIRDGKGNIYYADPSCFGED